MFDWCSSGLHAKCKREYKRFYIDNKTNKVVYLDETQYCECTTRSCPCFQNPKKDQKST